MTALFEPTVRRDQGRLAEVEAHINDLALQLKSETVKRARLASNIAYLSELDSTGDDKIARMKARQAESDAYHATRSVLSDIGTTGN